MSDVLANLTNITAPRVPLVDSRTNLISREWYRFFLSLFQLTGSGTSTINLTDLQVGPPNPEYGPIVTGGTNSVAVPTAGAVAYGTGIAYAFTGVGSATQVLTSAGSGTPTWSSPATGSVTSVGLTAPAMFTVSGSPVTTSGTLALTYSGTALPVANGGTGQITSNAAFNALAPSQTGNTGKYLTTDGSDTSWAANPLGTVTSVDVSGGTTGLTTSGGPVTTSGTITFAGILAVANGGTGSTTNAGTAYALKGANSDITSITGLTTALSATQGGTAQATYAAGDILYASASNTLSKLTVGTTGQVLKVAAGLPSWATDTTTGTVTSVSVVSANGLAGTVATATSTPAITLTTSITGVLKGNGTAISAAVVGTDYVGISAPVTKTADFVVADGESYLINNKTGSTCTATLPTASSWSGRSLTFTNYQNQTLVSASSNVVSRAGGVAATAILEASAGAWATLVSNGTNWLEVAGGIAPSTATFIITE